MTYGEKLKDPRWQRRRLEVLEARGWQCQGCDRKDKPLNVHHGLYQRGLDPWEYDDDVLWVLCDDCHLEAERQRLLVYLEIARIHPLEVLSTLARGNAPARPEPAEAPARQATRRQIGDLIEQIAEAVAAGDGDRAASLYETKRGLSLHLHGLPADVSTGADRRLEENP